MPWKYSQEFRDCAVGLVFDWLRDGSGVSRWAIISDTGLKLGVSRESLRRWVNQAEIDQGERSGVTREESAEIRRLRKENAELRRTNEILKLASAFFALTDAGIRSSTGTIGDSYDNALAETVNGLYKTELIYSQTWLMYRSRMGDPELGVLVESPASPRIARLFHSRGSDNPI